MSVRSQTVRGLIPAWAGKTRPIRAMKPKSRAHPRVGGENDRGAHMAVAATGSSPRGRGKLVSSRQQGRVARLIPAWAGKTRCKSSKPTSATAHPRVGGENSPARADCSSVRGSSPRGRGKRLHQRHQLHDRWLIPAWAGKTSSASWRLTAWAAHPRVGGENVVQAWRFHRSLGSSPRGRGKPENSAMGTELARLIPAWAGKTFRWYSGKLYTWAHPRVGGENINWVRTAHYTLGSSPRGRGKPIGRRRVHEASGLIPAWAGKTGEGVGTHQGLWAHPRVGGENSTVAPCTSRVMGSSPRGRGKLPPCGPSCPPRRLIPAWAGKTHALEGITPVA